MNVIVVGAGHMGRGLAERLCRQGHDVTVIDRNPEKLEGLDESFTGRRVQGVGFDRDLLARAGTAVAVCPGKTLRLLAKRRGWQILDWNA